MSQYFRMHRLFQLLSWIDALSRGYDAPDNRRRPAEEPLRQEPHRPPTISNLAYYLLTDADYNKDALEERFSYRAYRKPPDKKVFTYVKRDLTRHLAQYPGDLFTTKSVRKDPDDHLTFDDGLESRQVEAKVYYLTKRGQDRLADLTDVMQFKRDLTTTQESVTGRQGTIPILEKTDVLTDDAIEQIHGEVDTNTIETDSITVPVENRWEWKTATYRLPHVAVADTALNKAPTVYRD